MIQSTPIETDDRSSQGIGDEKRRNQDKTEELMKGQMFIITITSIHVQKCIQITIHWNGGLDGSIFKVICEHVNTKNCHNTAKKAKATLYIIQQRGKTFPPRLDNLALPSSVLCNVEMHQKGMVNVQQLLMHTS